MITTKTSSQTKHEAMIAAWDANCLHDKRLKLLIAPESFVAAQDIVLASGKVVGRGTRVFDWDTAKALSDEGKFGNGWRLPTKKEAECLADKAHLLSRTVRPGYVSPNDMFVCRHAPEYTDKRILNPNNVFFWTSTEENEIYAYFAEIIGVKTFSANASMCKSFGLSILCVKDT